MKKRFLYCAYYLALNMDAIKEEGSDVDGVPSHLTPEGH